MNGILSVLTVVLINDTHVANLCKCSSLIRILYAKMYNQRIHHTKYIYQLRYEIVHSVAKL